MSAGPHPPNLFLLLAGGFVVFGLIYFYDNGLMSNGIFTGWFLFIFLVFLTSYEFLKRSKRSLAASSLWVNAHVYFGFLSLFIFLWHIRWRLPNGIFETSLALLYMGTIISGLVGLSLYAIVPERLLPGSDSLTFQRIPQHIRNLRAQAEKIALESIDTASTTALAEHYNLHLAEFFLRPRILVRRLLGMPNLAIKQVKDISHISHPLNEEEIRRLEDIFQLVDKKDDLDYQYTLKFVIKAWVFFHAPLAYSMIIATLAHILIVYAYVG